MQIYTAKFIHKLLDDYNTLLDDEANDISQGQRQLLAIARAFLTDAVRIVVMNQGDVVETGTHTQLMGKKGVYADIYNSQFKQAA